MFKLRKQHNQGWLIIGIIFGGYLNAENVNIVDLEPFEVRGRFLSEFNESRTEGLPIDSFGTLQNTLDQTAGVFLNDSTGFALPSEIMIRGGEGNFTRLEVDGLEVNDPNDSRGSGFDINQFAAIDINNLWLDKGSLSSENGSGAISGVVSLNLGPLQSSGALLSMELGTEGMFCMNASTSFGTENVGIGAGIGKVVGNEIYEGHEFNTHGGYFKTLFSIGFIDSIGFSAWGTHSEQTRLPDDSGGVLYAVNVDEFLSRDVDTIGTVMDAILVHNDISQLAVTVGRYESDSDETSSSVPGGERNPFGVPASNSMNQFERYQFSLDYQQKIADILDLFVELETSSESGSSEGEMTLFPGFSLPTGYDTDRYKRAVASSAKIHISESQYLLLSARLDDVEDFESETTFGVKYGIDFDAINGSGYLRYSEGFKAPSLYALNNPLIGNRELVPEFGETVEIGINGTFDRVEWKFGAFTQAFSDMIDYSEVSQLLVNLNSVEIRGIEFEWVTSVSEELQIAFQMTYLDLDISDTDEILRNRPQLTCHTRALWTPVDHHTFELSYQYIGERWDSSIPTGNLELDGLHDVRLSWAATFSEHLQTSLSIRNLLNLDTQVVIGYENPGTQLIASFQYQW